MDLAGAAWDGWIGALIGGLIGAGATVLVGWSVLSRTIRHERDEAIEQRRLEAWAELAAAHLAVGPAIDEGLDAVRKATLATAIAVQKWQVYMSGDSRLFARLVVLAITTLNASAEIESVEEDGSFQHWRLPDESPRQLSDALLRNGRLWAMERDRRTEAQRNLHDAVGHDVILGPEDW